MPARYNWINQIGTQCGMPLGHVGTHGNGQLTTSRDEWHEANDNTTVQLTTTKTVTTTPFAVVHTDTSAVPQCLWCGTRSRCIYETGHTAPHKEEETHVG